MEFVYPAGATPIDADEAAGLLPRHLVTQADLNAWEEANIVSGETWALKQSRRELLDEGFVRDLHRKMFGKTWRWAGVFRSSKTNIGVDWSQIAVKLCDLLDNMRYQCDQSVFEADELAIRFHHQLVWVHAFPNGNGRHARLMADLLAVKLGAKRFSWGQNSLVRPGEARTRYLEALRTADQGDIKALLLFARN